MWVSGYFASTTVPQISPNCFMAFMNNNWFGAMIFGGILMYYYNQ